MHEDLNTPDSTGILVEAEEFAHYGGWVMDSQFEIQMGSPYLLAHGMGRPVADATTTVTIDDAGPFEVWVRAKDWVPSHHPGRFTLAIDGHTLDTEFGANGEDWCWQSAGFVDLPQGDVTFVLHDLSGFDGRCDAIFLGRNGAVPVDGADDAARAWRKRLRGLPEEPEDAGEYDVVVVGGGVAGCAATLSAARQGCRVALIQDRPVLGGNASKEIGLSPRGEVGPLVHELSERTDDGDLVAGQILRADPNISIFMERRVFNVATGGAKIISIDVREARSSRESRFRAPVFIDCTGTAILGLLAGAETLSGQEARSDFDEPTAPETGDAMHHGNTLFFRTRMADEPRPFPDVPWAVEVAKDYANLSGQLARPGIENAPGPIAGQNPDTPEFSFSKAFAEAKPGENPLMKFPATHFWEYGQWLDLYTQGEQIRDYLLQALFGTFSNVKRLEPETYLNLEFDWVAFVAAQGEFKRYRGDYILTERDIREHRQFPDAVVRNDGAFCLHYPQQPGVDYEFRLKDWKWDVRDNHPYAIPFRCLYSRNIDNLMMAGKHISVTHVAGSTTKFMGNGGQHGAAVGVAAYLCKKYETTPRGVCESHIDELQEMTLTITGGEHL
ncbi:MAG TPA: FAD-dependent oxidoreductase [Tepidiformaceae bacterium]|nr:FAD-dependent oxidoreductase [Tepidiformaceae bacterium]